MTFLVIHTRNVLYFTLSSAHPSYKVTTTTAQFTFYNRKSHFTTGEIVISYTLKYALLGSIIMYRDGKNLRFYKRRFRFLGFLGFLGF